jgi:hypothetical protein
MLQVGATGIEEEKKRKTPNPSLSEFLNAHSLLSRTHHHT